MACDLISYCVVATGLDGLLHRTLSRLLCAALAVLSRPGQVCMCPGVTHAHLHPRLKLELGACSGMEEEGLACVHAHCVTENLKERGFKVWARCVMHVLLYGLNSAAATVHVLMRITRDGLTAHQISKAMACFIAHTLDLQAKAGRAVTLHPKSTEPTRSAPEI